MCICAFSSLLCLGDPQISIFSSCHSPEHLYNPFLYLFTNIFLEPLKFLINQRELISPPLNRHCSTSISALCSSTSKCHFSPSCCPHPPLAAIISHLVHCPCCWQCCPIHPISTLPHQCRLVSWFVFNYKSNNKVIHCQKPFCNGFLFLFLPLSIHPFIILMVKNL